MKDIEALAKVDHLLYQFYFETMRNDDNGKKITSSEVLGRLIEIRGYIREYMTLGRGF